MTKNVTYVSLNFDKKFIVLQKLTKLGKRQKFSKE